MTTRLVMPIILFFHSFFWLGAIALFIRPFDFERFLSLDAIFMISAFATYFAAGVIWTKDYIHDRKHT